MVNVLEAMAKDSWPNGVTSWDDTVKFARLVFGEKVSVEDYSHRLPRPSKRSFLLFAKVACGPGTPFHEIGELIEPHLEEVKQYELRYRRNSARPEKSQQMLGSDNWTVHYWSTQLTRAPCTCRSGFGADSHQKHAPTASDMWATGERFAKLWNVTLQKNFESFGDRRKRPIWLDKTWQAVWNWNDHNQGHGIALHPDECDTYCSSDPITSFSFGHGGVLTLSDRKAAASKMLFQADGDALVMAGDFQSEFWHGVPERASWSVLQSRSMFDEMQGWEQRGLVDEIERHEKAVDGERHVRKNCTIRWHATHWDNCPSQCYGNQVRSGVAVRKSDAAEAAGSSEMPVPTVIGTAFAGVKRSQDEAEVYDEVSSVKTTRSLDTASADMVRKLLELVETASNSQVYRPMMLGMKLVGSQALHDENLCKVESTTLNLRKTLLNAQETVAGYGEKFAAKVSFADLDATALAAQQLRLLHRHLGDPANIRATLQTTIRMALEHLRTLDVERQYCDRYDGTLVSANYDIWIWLWVVE